MKEEERRDDGEGKEKRSRRTGRLRPHDAKLRGRSRRSDGRRRRRRGRGRVSGVGATTSARSGRIGREHWGRGIATASVRAFIAEIPDRPLHAYVAEHNVASMKVLVANGFVQVGRHEGEAVVLVDFLVPGLAAGHRTVDAPSRSPGLVACRTSCAPIKLDAPTRGAFRPRYSGRLAAPSSPPHAPRLRREPPHDTAGHAEAIVEILRWAVSRKSSTSSNGRDAEANQD